VNIQYISYTDSLGIKKQPTLMSFLDERGSVIDSLHRDNEPYGGSVGLQGSRTKS